MAKRAKREIDVRLFSDRDKITVITKQEFIRPHGAAVHFRTDPKHAVCAHCGQPATIWMDHKPSWEQHEAKCAITMEAAA